MCHIGAAATANILQRPVFSTITNLPSEKRRSFKFELTIFNLEFLAVQFRKSKQKQVYIFALVCIGSLNMLFSLYSSCGQDLMDMTAQKSLGEIAKKIGDSTVQDQTFYGEHFWSSLGHGTAHLGIVDTKGDAVILSSSLNSMLVLTFSGCLRHPVTVAKCS